MSNNPGNNNYQNLRDQNRVTVASGQSNLDSTQSLPFLINGITGRVLVDISSSLGAAWYNETPSGLVNGVNTTFTLANTPATNSLVLTIARQPQILGTDYTISGNTITYLSPPASGLTPHNAIYAVASGTLVGQVYVETPSGAIDGSNTVYTVSNTINTVIGIWINGEFIDPGSYIVSGAGFTMNTALPTALSGLPFTITYV